MTPKRIAEIRKRADAATEGPWEIVELIAHARTDIPALLDEIERLHGVVHDCPECGESCKQCKCHEAEMEKLRKRLKQLKSLHDHALDCVDKAFQDDGERKAILPNFLRAGERKFEGVVKLAEEYRRLREAMQYIRDRTSVLSRQ